MIKVGEFVRAARDGKIDTVRKYIEENVNNPGAINIAGNVIKSVPMGYLQDFAILCAIREGHAEIVEVLLAVKEIDLNVTNSNGETALMLAASRPFYSRILPVRECENSETPMSHAEVCKLYTKDEFLEKYKTYSDRERYYKDYQNMDKHYKAANKIFYALFALKDVKKINMNAVDRWGKTILWHARFDFVPSLVAAGADISAWGPNGKYFDDGKPDHKKYEYLRGRAVSLLVKNEFAHFWDSANEYGVGDSLFGVACFFATQERYAGLAHQLFKVAAEQGHDDAARIVLNFRNEKIDDLELEANDDNKKNKHMALSETKIISAAGILFFGGAQHEARGVKSSHPHLKNNC